MGDPSVTAPQGAGGGTPPESIWAGLLATPTRRVLVGAIVAMTLAIPVILGVIIGGLMSGSNDRSFAAVQATSLDEVVVTLPEGAELVGEDIADGRLLVRYRTPAGAREVLVLAAPERPVRIRYAVTSDNGGGAQ